MNASNVHARDKTINPKLDDIIACITAGNAERLSHLLNDANDRKILNTFDNQVSSCACFQISSNNIFSCIDILVRIDTPR